VLAELTGASGGGVVAEREARAFAREISCLLHKPDRARAMGEHGLAYWLANLTPQAVTDRHLAIYTRLLENAAD
jgi:glycosyltransferase involved in cell wall biosynthesis